MLAAGKLRREVIQPVPQPHRLQSLLGRHRITADLRRQFHIFQCRQILHQIIKLEHKPNVMPPVGDQLTGRALYNVAAVHQHLTFIGGVHATQNIQHCGLSCAGGPHNNGKFTLFYGKIDAVACCRDDLAGAVALVNIFHFHKCHWGCPPLRYRRKTGCLLRRIELY